MRFALILSLLIAIGAVAFAVYNPQEATINLVMYQVTSPLAVVVLVVLLMGVLLGIFACLPSIHRHRARARALEKELGAPPPVVPASKRAPEPARPADARPASAEPVADAAETQRLAAETQRMAADAQRRAAEAERRDTPPL